MLLHIIIKQQQLQKAMTRKCIFKPKNDNEFLEHLAFIRFASGFRYSLVETKWPDIKKAFHNFDVKKLAASTNTDVNKILQAKNMIKNRAKINDIIANAKICSEIAEEHGSVLKWIKKIKKNHKKDPLLSPSLKECFQRFRGIGETTSGWLDNLHSAKKSYVEYEVPG